MRTIDFVMVGFVPTIGDAAKRADPRVKPEDDGFLDAVS